MSKSPSLQADRRYGSRWTTDQRIRWRYGGPQARCGRVVERALMGIVIEPDDDNHHLVIGQHIQPDGPGECRRHGFAEAVVRRRIDRNDNQPDRYVIELLG